MIKVERELRGIPYWLLEEYLVKLGGSPEPDGWFSGDGWQARLTRLEDATHGHFRFTQVRLDWQAEPEAHAACWEKLERMIMRGGG